jgi:hypothetical protein
VNLFAPPPGPDWTNLFGEGLLGHPSFVLAASMRLKIFEEWTHHYEREGSSDVVEGARDTLRGKIQDAITTAWDMEDEWASITRRRFTSLEK